MLNILIVDDDFEYAKNIFNQLQNHSKREFEIVSITNNGLEAIDIISRRNIDVVLLDLKLPQMSGIDVIKHIEDMKKQLKVIIISGENNLLLDIINNNLAVYSIISKPFNFSRLIELLSEIENNYNCNENQSIIRKNIITTLDLFNFNINSLGYNYLVDFFTICEEENIKFIKDLNSIYSKVAMKNNIENKNKIKWNIDKCIQTMGILTSRDILHDYFTFQNLTTKTFLNKILSILSNNGV